MAKKTPKERQPEIVHSANCFSANLPLFGMLCISYPLHLFIEKIREYEDKLKSFQFQNAKRKPV